MRQTTNKSMNLPEYTDIIDIEELNENFEIVDEHFTDQDAHAELFLALETQMSAATAEALREVQTQLDGHTGDEEIHITPSEREKWNEAAGALQYHNAGVHNSIYRGKPLGSTVTAAQYAEIAAGTFKDLYIGDYWTIGGVNYRIAAFDYYLGCGDTACTQHHAVIVPDSSFYSAKMNETNTTEGGYTGSLMAREGIQATSNTIHTAFSGHILYHRVYLVDGVTNGHPSSGVWRDSSVRLMTEQMVYGGAIYMPIADGSAAFSNYRVEKSQLPLFAYEPSRISNGSAWWLRDVVAASSFAYINATGGASYLAASNVSGIRPVFSIC